MDKQLKQNIVVCEAITASVTKTIVGLQSTMGTDLPDTMVKQMVSAALQKRLSRHFTQ